MPFFTDVPFMQGSMLPLGRRVSGLLLVVLSGCYVPGGGWTLRSGIDTRQCRKPAVYMEMVDTRWDEWARVAQVNTTPTRFVPQTIIDATPPASNGPVPDGPVPQAIDPGIPSTGEAREPYLLPPANTNPPPVPSPPGPSAKNASLAAPELWISKPTRVPGVTILQQSAEVEIAIPEISDEWRPLPAHRARAESCPKQQLSPTPQEVEELLGHKPIPPE